MEDHRKKNSTLDLVDDLESDCCPLSDNIGKMQHEVFSKQNERFDSGVDSYNSFSSTHPSVEFLRGRPVEPTISDMGKNFQKLNIRNEITKEVENLPSVDEGYCDSVNVEEKIYTKLDVPCNSAEKMTYNTDELVEIFSQDNDGDSQLHMAIIQLLSAVALYFISKAPHFSWLNLTNDLLQTPLHLAVITRMKEVVRRLVVGGASIDMRDHKGDTPLHIASREGFDDIAETLLKPVDQEELQQNTYETIYQLIPQDLEARNYEGQTCLHLAAEGGHLPVLRLLIERGANINAQDGKSGRTALHYAAETGNMVLLEFLLLHPLLNVDAKTYGGCTPIMLAQGRGHQHVINRLRNAGAIYEPELSDSDDSEEEMETYDDICIGGQRVMQS